MRPAFVMAALALWLVAGCGMRLDDAELYKRAADHARKTEYRAASVDLRNLLQRSPSHIDARILLGESLLALGDYTGASAELQKARAGGASAARVIAPMAEALFGEQRLAEAVASDASLATSPADELRVRMVVGAASARLENWPQARDAFRRSLEIDPKNLRAQVGLAEALYPLEGAKSALAAAQAALTVDPDFAPAWNTIGSLHRRERRSEEALAAFRRARELATKSGDKFAELAAVAGIADVQLDAGNSAAALETTDELMRLSPGHPAALYRRARAKLLVAEYAESRALLEQLLSTVPDDPAARLLLGAVNYAEGNLGQADMYLSSVIAQQPANTFARRLLAETRVRANRPREAIEALGPIAADDVESGALAGRIALRGGDVEEGLRRLEQAAESAPTDPQRRLELAAAYLASGQTDRGLRLLEALPPSTNAPDRHDYLMLLAKGRQQDWPAALRLSKNLIERFPGSTPLYLLQAQFQVAAGRPQDARASLARAVEVDPKSSVVYIARGDFELQQADLASAEKSYTEALRIAPKSSVAQVGLARVAIARGDRAAASKQLEATVSANPQAVLPRLALSQLLLAQRDFKRAFDHAQAVVKLVPDDPTALDLLAQSGARVGQTKEILASVKEAVSRNPDSAALHFARARAELLAGNPREAQEAARAALQADADYVPAITMLTELALHQDRPQEAKELLARLERLDPSGGRTVLLRGDLAMKQRDYDAARTAYRKVLASHPQSAIVLREFQARQLGGDRAATESLREWLATHPKDIVVRLALADAQLEAGEREAATREYEAVLALDAGQVVALNNLAWIYFEMKDERALTLAQKAYERAPQSADVADTYGWVLLEKGDARRALEVLRKAQAASPRAREIRYHFAVALHRNGERAESRQVLETLLADGKAFTGSDRARELLESLRRPAS